MENDLDAQPSRGEAALLLSEARSEIAKIAHALGLANGNSSLEGRLSEAGAHIASVASGVSQSLGSSSLPSNAVHLLALQSAVQSTDLSELVDDAAAGGKKIKSIATIAAISAGTRADVEKLSQDVFDRHLFEPYLRFSSADDEAAFRARAAATQKYVTGQLDRNTPEGDLNAGGGMMGFMLDAHSHGAGSSPEFMPRWDKLADDLGKQRDAMQAAGQSTEEFDRNVGDSARRYLKAKGLSDDEIDDRLKGERNPLAAVKDLVKDDRDGRELELQGRFASHIQEASGIPLAHSEPGIAAANHHAPPLVDLSAVSARLKAAGVHLNSAAGENPAHGITGHGAPAKHDRGTPG